jgi:hypothetical protein
MWREKSLRRCWRRAESYALDGGGCTSAKGSCVATRYREAQLLELWHSEVQLRNEERGNEELHNEEIIRLTDVEGEVVKAVLA